MLPAAPPAGNPAVPDALTPLVLRTYPPPAMPCPARRPVHPSARLVACVTARWRVAAVACAGALVLSTTQAQVQTPTPSEALMARPATNPSAARPGHAGNDAVLELLLERGLVNEAMASPLVRQVRDRASEMVLSAMHFLGVPYRRGGNSQEDGFDCSGFTRHVFEKSLGLILPRRADEQARLGLLQQVRAEVAVLTPPGYSRTPHTFSHIFAGGYAAGYYSYKWAEVLSADAYAAFEEAGGSSALNTDIGRLYRQHILEVGGSRDAMESFKAFRGREPQIDALLRHQGLG